MNFSLRFRGMGALLLMVLVLVALFYIARGIYIVLSWATPVMLVVAAVLDYKVFVSYGRYVLRLLQERPLWGVLVVLLSVVALPLLSALLFFRALASYQATRMQKALQRRRQGEWAEYEEVEIAENESPSLEVPRPSKRSVARAEDAADYEQLFD